MVERLYGVVHGSELSLLGVHIEDWEVLPSKQLIDEIMKLPQGSVVGLETTPELLEDSPEKYFTSIHPNIKLGNGAYWRHLKDVCERWGTRIVYLDDLSLYQECARKVAEVSSLRDKLRDLGREEVQETREAVYKAVVEARYIHEVTREEKILENLRKYNPRLAVVGAGHGDLLFAEGKLISLGVSPENYRREMCGDPAELLLHNINPQMLIASVIEVPSPQEVQGIRIERRMMIRSYNAVTKWRILPDQHPRFIGTWDPDCRTRGLFEIYPDGETIEDSLGTAALVFAEMTEQRLSFVKVYDRSNSGPHVIVAPIWCDTEFDGEVYRGEWKSGQGRGKLIVARGGVFPRSVR